MKLNQKKSPAIHLKQHYQTLQSKGADEEIHPDQGMKKKSYALNNLQPDVTTNKFKKHSHSYTHSSIEFNKSQKKLDRNERRMQIEERQVEEEQPRKNTVSQQDSLPILNESYQEREHS